MIEKSVVVGETLDEAGGLMTARSFILTKKGEQLEKEELVLKVRAGPRSQACRQLLAARKGSGWKGPSTSNVSAKEYYLI